MIFTLFFLSCFAWYRDYFSWECVGCHPEWYMSCKTGWYQCDADTQGGKERGCGFLNAGCNIHCCRDEKDLCGWRTGNRNAGVQDTQGSGFTETECMETCALKNYEGAKVNGDRCDCLSDLRSFDPSLDWWKSCEFDNEPAYLTQERKECSDDHGQILTEKHCKYHLPKDEATFGVFTDSVKWTTHPYGCIVENGYRYWNNNWEDPRDPEDDTYLICRGGKPLSVSKGDSTGQCPDGQRLTEYECQYQVDGFGVWDEAWEASGETCGCYLNGNRRVFNRAKGACDTPRSGEEMICKRIVPEELCNYIVDEVEGTEGGGQTPMTVEYLGQTIHIGWNVVLWNPTAQCVTTSQKLVEGPIKCNAQESCPVKYEYTKSQTTSWTTSNGASLNVGASMEFEAGIPLIFEFDAEVEAGFEYDLRVDHERTTGIDETYEETASCKNYDIKTSCYVFTQMSKFNTTAEAGPTFYLLEEGKTETSFIDCEEEFGLTTTIAWEAKTGRGYEARGIPNCEDTPGACGESDFGDCDTDFYTQQNCPETCAEYGLGPAACPGPKCGFTPVEADDCPAPADLDKEGEPYTDCLTCFNGSPMPCQARLPFPAGSGPDDWNIRNCPDDHGHLYNIFYYSCDIEEVESEQKEIQKKWRSIEKELSARMGQKPMVASPNRAEEKVSARMGQKPMVASPNRAEEKVSARMGQKPMVASPNRAEEEVSKVMLKKPTGASPARSEALVNSLVEEITEDTLIQGLALIGFASAVAYTIQKCRSYKKDYVDIENEI